MGLEPDHGFGVLDAIGTLQKSNPPPPPLTLHHPPLYLHTLLFYWVGDGAHALLGHHVALLFFVSNHAGVSETQYSQMGDGISPYLVIMLPLYIFHPPPLCLVVTHFIFAGGRWRARHTRSSCYPNILHPPPQYLVPHIILAGGRRRTRHTRSHIPGVTSHGASWSAARCLSLTNIFGATA